MHTLQFLMYKILLFTLLFFCNNINAQVKWIDANTAYAPLPGGFNVFTTTDSLEGKPFKAFYAIADIKNKKLKFTTDTTSKRRLTPAQFFEKNNKPLLVVNSTFFSFATNQNLNLVIKEGRLVGYNIHTIPQRGKDTFTFKHPFAGAIGISKKRKADVAWTYTDSSEATSYASQYAIPSIKDSTEKMFGENVKSMEYSYSIPSRNIISSAGFKPIFKKWKMQTAVGGGPVLVQNGQIKITNNEELKFAGDAINDKHPRTLMGYTKDNKLIVMVIEGRNPAVAEGASLVQAAQLMLQLGCVEALNLDGGGSSCMLINGKETIEPSDKGLQRAVPAVFIIYNKPK